MLAVQHDRLARAGLVEGRAQAAEITLGGFLDSYIASRIEVKPFTLANYRQARRLLVEYFRPDRPITAITPGDAADFRRHLSRRMKKTRFCRGLRRLAS